MYAEECLNGLALSPEPKAQGAVRWRPKTLNTGEKANAQASIAPFNLSPELIAPAFL